MNPGPIRAYSTLCAAYTQVYSPLYSPKLAVNYLDIQIFPQ